jgi:hypothetical protein
MKLIDIVFLVALAVLALFAFDKSSGIVVSKICHHSAIASPTGIKQSNRICPFQPSIFSYSSYPSNFFFSRLSQFSMGGYL